MVTEITTRTLVRSFRVRLLSQRFTHLFAIALTATLVAACSTSGGDDEPTASPTLVPTATLVPVSAIAEFVDGSTAYGSTLTRTLTNYINVSQAGNTLIETRPRYSNGQPDRDVPLWVDELAREMAATSDAASQMTVEVSVHVPSDCSNILAELILVSGLAAEMSRLWQALSEQDEITESDVIDTLNASNVPVLEIRDALQRAINNSNACAAS